MEPTNILYKKKTKEWKQNCGGCFGLAKKMMQEKKMTIHIEIRKRNAEKKIV